ARAPASELQFTRVLNNDDIATRNPSCRARGRVAHHLASRHRVIVQEARKPDLLRPPPRKPPDTRAGPLDKGRVQGGPPFSRRRSPNRPSPNSIATSTSANQQSIHGISPCNYRQSRCVHTIAPQGGGELNGPKLIALTAT